MSNRTEAQFQTQTQSWAIMKDNFTSAFDHYMASQKAYLDGTNQSSGNVHLYNVQIVYDLIGAAGQTSVKRETDFQYFCEALLTNPPTKAELGETAPTTSEQELWEEAIKSYAKVTNVLGDLSACFQESILPNGVDFPDRPGVLTLYTLDESQRAMGTWMAQVRARNHQKQSIQNTLTVAQILVETGTVPSLVNFIEDLKKTNLAVQSIYGDAAPHSEDETFSMLLPEASQMKSVFQDDLNSLTACMMNLAASWKDLHTSLSNLQAQDIELLVTSLDRTLYWHNMWTTHLTDAGALEV